MRPFYVHHDGPRAHLLPLRPLLRQALAHGLPLSLGVCRGDEALFADFATAGLEVVVGPLANMPRGAPFGLAACCPPGHAPLPLRWGHDFDPAAFSWEGAVKAFHRGLRRHGCQVTIADPEGPVPMFDLGADLPAPRLPRPGIYLDLERSLDPRCWFVCDLPRLAAVLPDHDVYCTRVPAGAPANVFDVADLGWPARAALANACDVLVGTTFDPFALVLTEANRDKPKALCGHDPRVTPPFWDYPGNALELLPGMDDLVDFLLANVAEVTA